MAIFPTCFFLGNIAQENVFEDILERKNAFLGYKNKKFKKTKNWHFFKGVNPWFWSKNGHFSNLFFLGNVGQENVFYDILEEKKRLSRLEKQEVQKVDKLIFFQRGWPMVLVQNWPFFQPFFFWQCRPGKCLPIFLSEKTPF